MLIQHPLGKIKLLSTELKHNNLLSIGLNNSDAVVLCFGPFPHSVSFAFQNWASIMLHIHTSLGAHCAALVSGFTSTSSVSMSSVSANLMVHQLDNVALSLDSPLLFIVALVVLGSNLVTYPKESLGVQSELLVGSF